MLSTFPYRDKDRYFMAAAIRLARTHLGQTAENPAVGAIIVRDDGFGPYIVGRGVTGIGGRPHAEALALEEAGERALGATIYTTVEPCSHYGQTPSCADSLIAAGVGRVVIAVIDPDKRVNGAGVQRLKNADILVQESVMEPYAKEGISAYLHYKNTQCPEVTVKLAVSSDGFLSEQQGGGKITGTIAQHQVHLLRAEQDAILVGSRTILIDNPMLNCRLPGLQDRSPIRIVLDSCLQIPLESHLVQTAKQHPVWILCGTNISSIKLESLILAGCDVVCCELDHGKIDLNKALSYLGSKGIQSVLVEGGAIIAESFWSEGLVDRLILLESPLILGEKGGSRLLDFTHRINNYQKIRSQQLGVDLMTEWKKKV